jgi:hypothetical protein
MNSISIRCNTLASNGQIEGALRGVAGQVKLPATAPVYFNLGPQRGRPVIVTEIAGAADNRPRRLVTILLPELRSTGTWPSPRYSAWTATRGTHSRSAPLPFKLRVRQAGLFLWG